MSMQVKDLDFEGHCNIPYAYRVLLEKLGSGGLLWRPRKYANVYSESRFEPSN
jgi:hypothetical protein